MGNTKSIVEEYQNSVFYSWEYEQIGMRVNFSKWFILTLFEVISQILENYILNLKL